MASIKLIQPPAAELWPTMIAEVENHRAGPAPCRNKPQSCTWRIWLVGKLRTYLYIMWYVCVRVLIVSARTRMNM